MVLAVPCWAPLCARAGSPRLCLSARHCLSQQDCVCSQGCYWKDLTQLGRDLATTVGLDHTMQGFPAQVGHCHSWGICVSWLELCGVQPSPCPLPRGHGDRKGTGTLAPPSPTPSVSPRAGGRAPRDPAALPAPPAAH
uniref:FCP1 homology domain-containing protein n=1 Tax=Zonotrichia albicollis TaxID=44394 RepID=A0A8D2MAQ3_ZONAL